MTNNDNSNGNVINLNNYGGGTKQKYDLSSKIQTHKLKLLKPKTNASNGGKINFHFNLEKPYLYCPNNAKNDNNNSNNNINNLKFSPLMFKKNLLENGDKGNAIKELLKNPKIKFPNRNIKFNESSISNNKTKENQSMLDLESTNITNITNLTNVTEFTTDKNNTTQNEIKPYTKVSNVHKLKDIRNNNKAHMNTICMTRSIDTENSLNYDADNTPKLRIRNCKSVKNNLRGKFNVSSHLTNINETLPINFQKLIKLRNNRSVDSRKEGIEIIDDIIKGLTKLKTIIANDEEEELGTIYRDDREDQPSLPTENKMLISSLSGDVIKREHKQIVNLKNNSSSHQTIEQNEHDTSTLLANKNSFSKLNESLMMQIQTEYKSNKSFTADRYRETENSNTQDKTIYVDQSKHLKLKKINLNETKYFLNNRENLTPNAKVANKFKIDKFEYKVLNTNVNNPNKNSTKNKHNVTANYFPFNSFQRKEKEVAITIDSTKNKNMNNIFKTSVYVDNEDFANYEFID